MSVTEQCYLIAEALLDKIVTEMLQVTDTYFLIYYYNLLFY